MSLNEKKYYVMQYDSSDDGCPISLAGFFNCERFEWSPYELNPEKLEIRNKYRLSLSGLEMDVDSLDFDFYQVGATYVSRKFLDVCDLFGSKYRAIPLEISLGDEIRKDDFFIFLPGESLPALDKYCSVYELAKDLETGEVVNSPLFPGEVSVSRIDSFVISAGVKSDVFRCQETLQMFCSDRFKAAATLLKGISFAPVDETYRYDPWAEFDDL